MSLSYAQQNIFRSGWELVIDHLFSASSKVGIVKTIRILVGSLSFHSKIWSPAHL